MIARCRIPSDVASAAVEDGAVVLHMGTKRYYSLNETGAAIWALLETGVPVAQIPARLTDRYDVAIDDATDALEALLVTLAAGNLLLLEAE